MKISKFERIIMVLFCTFSGALHAMQEKKEATIVRAPQLFSIYTALKITDQKTQNIFYGKNIDKKNYNFDTSKEFCIERCDCQYFLLEDCFFHAPLPCKELTATIALEKIGTTFYIFSFLQSSNCDDPLLCCIEAQQTQESEDLSITAIQEIASYKDLPYLTLYLKTHQKNDHEIIVVACTRYGYFANVYAFDIKSKNTKFRTRSCDIHFHFEETKIPHINFEANKTPEKIRGRFNCCSVQ